MSHVRRDRMGLRVLHSLRFAPVGMAGLAFRCFAARAESPLQSDLLFTLGVVTKRRAVAPRMNESNSRVDLRAEVACTRL